MGNPYTFERRFILRYGPRELTSNKITRPNEILRTWLVYIKTEGASANYRKEYATINDIHSNFAEFWHINVNIWNQT